MYDKRIKIFVVLLTIFLLVCLIRLVQMQLLPNSSLQDEITELKLQKGHAFQLKTVRGRILDRKGSILAEDVPQFQLHINYRLSCFLDERVRRAKLLRAADRTKMQGELEAGLEELQQVIEKCTYFGLGRTEIEDRISKINNGVWNLRTFLAWVKNGPDPDILEKYENKAGNVPLSVAIADFEKKFPQDKRLLLTAKVDDIAEMSKDWPVLELKADDDIFTAQLEFKDVNELQILPVRYRFYPYRSVAAQTIGWVGPSDSQQGSSSGDKLSGYPDDEICGRENGVEYVCEAVLGGKRGKAIYDIDSQLISRIETQLGKDISLTLDIELQKKIEDYLVACLHQSSCGPGISAVVVDVASGDILALASIPTFDLNQARQDYNKFISDTNRPMINRAISEHYPPGSCVKPLILIAGLESGKITPEEIISCPAHESPTDWPNCLQFTRFNSCHDWKWDGLGGNKARNAIKGSCNVYFSHLADRIEPAILQKWLFDFGYGRKIPLSPASIQASTLDRDFRQAQGQISNVPPKSTISSLEQLPPLEKTETRWFGIGQGNLRVTPLQVANAMAAIARGGIYKLPQLFVYDSNDLKSRGSISLNISQKTLDVVRDGMSAVVNEDGGTAHEAFVASGFAEQGVKVYGKTGSTEAPENAWFAGFAEDNKGRSIAIAVVVEKGQSGSKDAAPLARQIIQFCIECGYVSKAY